MNPASVAARVRGQERRRGQYEFGWITVLIVIAVGAGIGWLAK